MLNSVSKKTWLACAIDGEGSIALIPKKRRHSWEIPAWIFLLRICNTEKRFCVKALESCGVGTVTCANKRRAKWKAVYEWRTTDSRKIRRILTAIIPYLTIPRKQTLAKLCREACTLVRLKNKDVRRRNNTRLWRIYRSIRDLNKRGVG